MDCRDTFKSNPLDGIKPRGNGCYANHKAVICVRPYHSIKGELELANVVGMATVLGPQAQGVPITVLKVRRVPSLT